MSEIYHSAAEKVNAALTNAKPDTSGGGLLMAMPNGRVVTVDQLPQMRFRLKVGKEFLGNPDILLKDPQPGYYPGQSRYGWPIKGPRTNGLMNGKLYRAVRKEELKEDCPYEVSTHEGVNGESTVEWYNHILVEIRKDYYDEYMAAPAFNGLYELAAKLNEGGYQSEAAQIAPSVRTHSAMAAVKG